MKKLFILALFMLGINIAPVLGMFQEVILCETYSIVPLDDARDETNNGRPNPNRFSAFVDGNQLLIVSDAREPIYIEVISKKSGQVVAAGEVVGSSVLTISRPGAYTLQVYSNNTLYSGEFVVE